MTKNKNGIHRSTFVFDLYKYRALRGYSMVNATRLAAVGGAALLALVLLDLLYAAILRDVKRRREQKNERFS